MIANIEQQGQKFSPTRDNYWRACQDTGPNILSGGKDEGSRRARKSFTDSIYHTFGSSLLLSLFVVELKAVRRDCERGLLTMAA